MEFSSKLLLVPAYIEHQFAEGYLCRLYLKRNCLMMKSPMVAYKCFRNLLIFLQLTPEDPVKFPEENIEKKIVSSASVRYKNSEDIGFSEST